MWVLYLVSLIALEALAEMSLKQWAVTQRARFVLAGCVMYVLVALLFALTLRTEASGLVQLNTLWQVGNIVLITCVAVLVFGERLSYKHMLGVSLAVVSTVLMA